MKFHNWIIIAAVTLITSLIVLPASAQEQKPETVKTICDNLNEVTLGSIRGNNSYGNIYDEGSRKSGNTFCRVHIRDGQYWTSIEELGNMALVNAFPSQAVDVYGILTDGAPYNENFTTPVRICLRGSGTVYFLRSTDADRALETLFDWEAEAGYRCVDLLQAGTVVLAQELPAAPVTPSTAADDTKSANGLAAADPAAVIPLENCEVITDVGGLFLRREPNVNARIRFQFMFNQTLTATGYSGNWYQVDFNRSPGWLNADYVRTNGDCGNPQP